MALEGTSANTLTGRLGEFSTGTAGAVANTRIARITQWSITSSLSSTNEWGDSDVNGYTARSSGRKDATFEAEGKYDTVNDQWNLFAPGDLVSAALWVNASLCWAFPRALCTNFGLTINIDSEEVVGWTSSWGADGIFYRPGQAGAPVNTYQDA